MQSFFTPLGPELWHSRQLCWFGMLISKVSRLFGMVLWHSTQPIMVCLAWLNSPRTSQRSGMTTFAMVGVIFACGLETSWQYAQPVNCARSFTFKLRLNGLFPPLGATPL